VPTADSSTEVRGLRRDLADLRTLCAFRLAAVRGRSRRTLRIAVWVLLAITVASALLPALAPTSGGAAARETWTPALQWGLAAFVLMAAGASIGTGGGRELISREQGVAFPVSPATDHFGALVMAPLNIAWLLQVWLLLGLTSYAGGPAAVLTGTPVVLLWVLVATAVGQLAGWAMETLRRGPHGVLRNRAVLGAGLAGALVLTVTDRWRGAVELVPTAPVADAAVEADAWWPLVAAALGVALVLSVLAGIPVARAALRRPPREEQRLETGHHRARATAAGPTAALADLRMLLRIDRGSVLRSVPLRRGLAVLAVLPGLGALAAHTAWSMVVVLPGLVAAAVALLFAVNAWSLDGRGALWRESLPTSPGLVFVARSLLVAEATLLATGTTVLLAAARAGLPTATELAALGCGTAVVTLQVVATSARWSVRNPYATDLRSSRAVPAPPTVMLGYSARLALGTTFTGMLFSAAAQGSSWLVAPVLAAPFLAWSGVRLVRAGRAWGRPADRSRVVTAVAA